MTKADYLTTIEMYSYKTGMSTNQILHDTIQRIQVVGEVALQTIREENPFITEEDIKQLRERQDHRIVDEVVERVRTAMKEYKETGPKSAAEGFVKGIKLNSKVVNVLKGFAVIREEKTGRIHIYYQDPGKKSLKGKLETTADCMHADSGFYVNFEEFMVRIMSGVGKTVEEAETARLIKKDGSELALMDAFTEIYAALKERGAISFGNEIGKRKMDTLEDLRKLKLKETEYFQNEPLRTGVYVRRDLLIEALSKYKLIPTDAVKSIETQMK